MWADPLRGGEQLVTDFKMTLSSIKKKILTDREVLWSPKGTFLISTHENGIKFWLQEDVDQWKLTKKFLHNKLSFFDISPGENYLVTCCNESELLFWDTKTVTIQRPFKKIFSKYANLQWPYFKFSFNDMYFACIDSSRYNPNNPTKFSDVTEKDSDKITLFSTSNFKRLNSGSIKAPRVRIIEFNPKKLLLAYVCASNDLDKPTTISLLSVTTQNLLSTNSHFQALTVNLFWHQNGDYLCVAVTKKKKKKKKKETIIYTVEL